MLKYKKYNPPTELDFWCSSCDRKTVNSNNAASGSFFMMFGHTINPKTQVCDGEGEYVPIVFALCTECVPKG